MKILFSKCDLKAYMDGSDSNVKIGIGWYKHHPNLKWKGFTLELYCLFWLVTITHVNNYEEYDKHINYRKYRKKT